MILNITEAANLALHSLVYLANHQAAWPISTARAAAPFSASEAHLNKVFQRLNKAGLVGSVRGPRGGFVLAREPAEITRPAAPGALPAGERGLQSRLLHLRRPAACHPRDGLRSLLGNDPRRPDRGE